MEARACGQGMWTGESHPGDGVGTGWRCGIPESACKVSSSGQVGFSERGPRPPAGVGWGGEQGCRLPRTKQRHGEGGALLTGMWPFPSPAVSGLTLSSIQSVISSSSPPAQFLFRWDVY